MTTPATQPSLGNILKSMKPLAPQVPGQAAPLLPGQRPPAPAQPAAPARPAAPAQPAAPQRPAPPAAAPAQPNMPEKTLGHGDKLVLKHAARPVPPGPGSFKLHIPKDDAAEMFHVQATPENMQALVTWLNAFDNPSTLGPTAFSPNARLNFERAHPNDPQMLTRVQQALARRGYNVKPTGTWDNLTSSAVVQFKQSRGIHEPFKTPDGKWAITPFLDANMTNQILN